jgi:DNA helicase-2/ATP-dependent DNA helicase PcrA
LNQLRDPPGSAAEDAIPREEERLLARVRESVTARLAEARRARRGSPAGARADEELVALRDEMAEARLEDVPALVAQMERLQGVSMSRTEAQAVLVDPESPYFGHLGLVESTPRGGTTERDVLIGRATYVDAERRVSIVDWRHAPVSQLYYRYEEGSDYEERFGEREAEGEIRARRTLTIERGVLVRVACPQGVWTKDGAGDWHRSDEIPHGLAGGEGTATRPTLGAGLRGAQRLDRHLPEIAALIDPHQFEIITDKRAGVVVVQGGAGSGKTTIGLHRIAFLAHKGINPRKMLVVTYGAALAAYMSQVLPALGVHGVPVLTFEGWATRELRRAIPWLNAAIVDDAPPAVTRVKSHPALLAELERRAAAHAAAGRPRTSRAVVELWGDLLTDRRVLASADGDVTAVGPVLADSVSAVLDRDFAEERRRAKEPLPADEDIRGDVGIDGVRTDGEPPRLDLLDVAILLRAHQILRGGGKRQLAHLFVDEAQDLSPVELSALIGQTAEVRGQRSVTLAGDTAQRLFLDNGFLDWKSVLEELGLSHVAVEPLRIAYRSTREILALARHVMGPLAVGEPPVAPRSGAPVEALRFPGAGAAVAFLAEALRRLAQSEPRATVAILARHPEQADRYFEGLRRAEVPALRRVHAQEFGFRPGVEVTEICQAKGLEFDYVVLVDANAGTFGTDDESRHLFHIGATRAAHQLWLVVTAAPSPLVPPDTLSA